jgi:hypothetical protein
MATTHEPEIDKWSQRVGHPVRVPRVMFPWPSAPVWHALLDPVAKGPELVWDEDPKGLST